MRRELGTLMFTAFVVLASPFVVSAGPADGDRDTSAAPVAVQRVSVPVTGLRDEAAMVLVGTALIGLAAAVRRAA